MLPSKDRTYYCQQCNSYSGTLHEVVFGSANKQISIRKNVQVPLCQPCHMKAHANKLEYQRIFLTWLEMDFWRTIRAFNSAEYREYLEQDVEYRKDKIMGLLV